MSKLIDTRNACAQMEIIMVSRAQQYSLPKRTGNLMNSIRAEKRESTGFEVHAGLGPKDVQYAEYVEYGTDRMPPRNYMLKAFLDMDANAVDIIGDNFK